MIIWFAAGTALILLELVTPTFALVFFGLGAWGAALVAYFLPGTMQELAAFIVVTLFSFVLFRKKLRKIFSGFEIGNHKNPATQNFAYVGKQATVSKDISPQKEGEISVGGSFWRAKATVDIPKDAIVIIVEQDGEDNQLLIVKPQE